MVRVQGCVKSMEEGWEQGQVRELLVEKEGERLGLLGVDVVIVGRTVAAHAALLRPAAIAVVVPE